MKDKKVIIIGYSGHSFVVCDIFISQNIPIIGYCEEIEKKFNPYNLQFLGSENLDSVLKKIFYDSYFTAIGDNVSRQRINTALEKKLNFPPLNAIHLNSTISTTATLGSGIMVGNYSIINACSSIGNGVICNTQSVVEHDCIIDDFSHIGPGAVLCGGVQVGAQSFIGAQSVIKEGIKIGSNVIVGAGTVVIKDIPNNSKVAGNPHRFI